MSNNISKKVKEIIMENEYQDVPDGWICEPCKNGRCEECLDSVVCECKKCNK